jgi:Holliday junction resolvasome RuvABC endonuclease subunit
MKQFIAIDPGANGAIVYGPCSGTPDPHPMPKTPGDILELLRSLDLYCAAVLENVHGYMPGNGVASACKFAQHIGHLEMALHAAGIPFVRVTPQKWMQALLGKVPKDKAERKHAIKQRVQERFPSLKVTLNNADALAMWWLRTQGKI